MSGAADRGQARFDTYGGNYIKLTFRQLADAIPGFGFPGSPELSENESKYYRTTVSGWTVIQDLSMTYFRVMDPHGHYTDQNGDTKPAAMSDPDSMAISHFRTN
jgi:hypothetical protein